MDILFLLRKDFTDPLRDQVGINYYCPDCAFLEGILSYFPQLRSQLDIRYIDFPRPRKEITELVGEVHQGCPNLILDPSHHNCACSKDFFRHGERLHTTDTRLIADYLSEVYGIPKAHF
jgi:hypothetical protein